MANKKESTSILQSEMQPKEQEIRDLTAAAPFVPFTLAQLARF
jgi:hypothetical protein